MKKFMLWITLLAFFALIAFAILGSSSIFVLEIIEGDQTATAYAETAEFGRINLEAQLTAIAATARPTIAPPAKATPIPPQPLPGGINGN